VSRDRHCRDKIKLEGGLSLALPREACKTNVAMAFGYCQTAGTAGYAYALEGVEYRLCLVLFQRYA